MITKCGSEWEPTQEMMQGWAKTCPDINVQGQLDRMTMWCQANKAKRKTIGGMFKFANTWLDGEQSKAARAKASGQKKKNSMRAQGIDANLSKSLREKPKNISQSKNKRQTCILQYCHGKV